MISIIPQRTDMWRQSVWFGTLRYFWEIIFHSRHSPGVASSVWLVNKDIIDALGGFGRWRDRVQPEQAIAQALTDTKYQLFISTPAVGITYEKKWSSQIESSRRTLLPRFGNSIANTMIGAGLLTVVVLPQVMFVASILSGWDVELWGAILIGILVMMCSVLYYRLVWARGWWFAPLVTIYVAWQELFVLVSSAIAYHRGTVVWKGRTIVRPSDS